MRHIIVALALITASPAFAADRELDTLFSALAKTQTADDAKPIEEQILAKFLVSGSPTVDLLMTRAAAALNGDNRFIARRLIDDVTKIAPNYAEAWRLRGKLEALDSDDTGAVTSLSKAVALNPREFAAQAELGQVLLQDGDKKDALASLRKALSLDPHYDNLDRLVERLAREVEGEKI